MCCSCARPPLGAPRLDLGARARRVARRLRTSFVVTVTTVVVVLVLPSIASVVTLVVVVIVWVTTIGPWSPCGLSLDTMLVLTPFDCVPFVRRASIPFVRVPFSIPFDRVRCSVPFDRVRLPFVAVRGRGGLPLLVLLRL